MPFTWPRTMFISFVILPTPSPSVFCASWTPSAPRRSKRMADNKWMIELAGDTPLADAARQVLAARLGLVPERLAGALTEPDRDLEHVHQLRVATRRAGAALAVFA